MEVFCLLKAVLNLHFDIQDKISYMLQMNLLCTFLNVAFTFYIDTEIFAPYLKADLNHVIKNRSGVSYKLVFFVCSDVSTFPKSVKSLEVSTK